MKTCTATICPSDQMSVRPTVLRPTARAQLSCDQMSCNQLSGSPFDLQNPIVSLQQPSHYAQNIGQYISYLADDAKTNTIHAQRQYKSRYDTNRSNSTYSINDLVLIKNIHSRHKFDIRYEGPFRIIRRFGVKTYLVQHVKLLDLTRQVTVDLLLPVSTG